MENLNLKQHFNALNESAFALENDIINIFKENGIDYLLTDVEDFDIIYTYMFDCCDSLNELQVKGIRVIDDRLEILVDGRYVKYKSIQDLKDCEDDWVSVFGGEVLGIFTIYNIAEVLDEYLEEQLEKQ